MGIKRVTSISFDEVKDTDDKAKAKAMDIQHKPNKSLLSVSVQLGLLAVNQWLRAPAEVWKHACCNATAYAA